jgi:hypothetical protein
MVMRLESKMRRNKGRMCRVNKRKLRGLEFRRGERKFDGWPCCVEENRTKVYAPVSRQARIKKGINKSELAVMGARSKISPIKLIDGGADIFAAQAINHSKAIEGNSLNRPLVMYSLRV